jgi:hypothetical protein
MVTVLADGFQHQGKVYCRRDSRKATLWLTAVTRTMSTTSDAPRR